MIYLGQMLSVVVPLSLDVPSADLVRKLSAAAGGATKHSGWGTWFDANGGAIDEEVTTVAVCHGGNKGQVKAIYSAAYDLVVRLLQLGEQCVMVTTTRHGTVIIESEADAAALFLAEVL